MQTESFIDQPGLFTSSFIANPYPTYKAIRELGRPYWFPYDGDKKRGMWLFANYADVDALLKETRHTTNDITPFLPAGGTSPLQHTMLQSDPPEHTRQRKRLGGHFSSGKLEPLQERIEHIVNARIERIRAGNKDRIDFVEDFAVGIPLTLSAELFGISGGDIPKLRDWSRQISDGLDYIRADENLRRQQHEAVRSIQGYFAGWLEDAHLPPENTIAHDLVHGCRTHGTPGRDELLATLMLLFIASHENITNIMGNGLLALLQNPQQKQRLLEAPDRIDAAIEEMLRYDGSVQRANLRVAVDEIEIGGQVFTRGDHLSPLLAAANRDPALFRDPDVFDISRTPARHLAFGAGPHVCLGAALARMQLRTAFLRLLQAWPEIRLADEPPQWKTNTVIRGLQHLPVILRSR